nr:protein kinase [Planctomycetia bacterium]
MTEARPLQGEDDEFGRYKVEETPFAVGGMGVLWIAEDLDLQRRVAVKSLRSELLDRRAAYERLARETRVLSLLSHPGICPIHDRYLLADPPCYTMQLVEGTTFKEAIDSFHRTGGLEQLRTLVTRLISICNTLAYAHGQGVLHRDLKPENILLGSYGEVYVMDWGVAAIEGIEDFADDASTPDSRSELSMGGEVLGTPAYAAPEQLSGERHKCDARVDVYGLGAILFEVLTAKIPGKAEETRALLEEKKIWQIRSGFHIPSDLLACCLKATANKREDRYSSILEFRSDLENFLSGNLMIAADYSTGEVARKWYQRNRPMVLGSGTVALLALSVLVIGLINFFQGIDQARKESERALAKALQSQGAFLLKDHRPLQAQELFARALKIEERLDDPTLPANLYLADAFREAHAPTLKYSYGEMRGESQGFPDCYAHNPIEGHLYVAEGQDIKVFDIDSGQRLHPFTTAIDEFKDDATGIFRLAFSPDYKRLAILKRSAESSLVEIRDAQTGKLERTIQSDSRVFWIRFRPIKNQDGYSQIALLQNHGVDVWNIVEETALPLTLPLEVSSQGVYSFDYSADGEHFLVGSGEGTKSIALYQSDSGEKIWSYGGTNSGEGIFLSDQRRILARSGVEIVLLDRLTGEELDRLSMSGDVIQLLEAPDRSHAIVVRRGGEITLCNLDNLNDLKWVFQGGWVYSRMSYFASKDRFISVDNMNRDWFVWGEEIWGEDEEVLLGKATALDVHPTEDVIAVGGLGWLALHDLVTHKKLISREIEGKYVSSVKFSPDGSELLIAIRYRDEGMRLNSLTLEEISQFPAKRIAFLEYSPEGEEFVSAENKNLLLINSESGEVKKQIPMNHRAWFAGYSPAGNRLVTAHHSEYTNTNKTRSASFLRVWDRPSGELLNEFDLIRPNYSVRFAPNDEEFYLGQWTGDVVHMDLNQGQIKKVRVHSSPILDLAISRDGEWLLTRTYGYNSYLIDTETLQMRWKFEDISEGTVTTGRAGGAEFYATRGNRLIALDPEAPYDYLNLKDEALNAARKIQIDPNDTDALIVLGKWCLYRNSYELAYQFFTRAKETGLDPTTKIQTISASRQKELPFSLLMAESSWCAG